MFEKNKIIVIAILLLSVIVGVLLVNQNQDIRNKAKEISSEVSK